MSSTLINQKSVYDFNKLKRVRQILILIVVEEIEQRKLDDNEISFYNKSKKTIVYVLLV